MTDHDRPLLSCFAALVLALAPACDEFEHEASLDDDDEAFETTDDEFRNESCPAGWNLYGEWAGGFCCDGYTDGNTCSGNAVCALDPSRTQGNRMCSTYECPSNWTLYGSWAGGFCCSGTPSGGYCPADICALDESRTQGFPMCSNISACPEGKTVMSGMCCNGNGTECEQQMCPNQPGYRVCFSTTANMPMSTSTTACTFIAAANEDVPGATFTVPDWWQTHTRSVVAHACNVELEHVFVYDGYGQTSDSNVFGFNSDVNGIGGNLYPWIENDARSMWLSASNKYVCLVHEGSEEWRTCVPPSSTVFNLAPDFNDQVSRIDAWPNWVGMSSNLWEDYGASGQSIYVSADEDFYYRPILTGGQWRRWDDVVSSFRVNAGW